MQWTRIAATLLLPGLMAGPVIAADVTGAPSLQSNYRVRDLAAEAQHDFDALGMNDAGVVVGRAGIRVDENVVQRAVLFDGTLHAIDASSPLEPFVANAINASGRVTGRTADSRAFFYDGAAHPLPPVPSQTSEGRGINAAGRIVGDIGIPVRIGLQYFPDSRAFFYDGSMHDLGGLGGGGVHAVAINDSDQVAGYARLTSGATHAFLFDGQMHDLGTVIPGGTSQAAGINNAGQVVGWASDATGHTHAFLYDGTMHDLGTLGGLYSRANAINSAGLIVGSATRPGEAGESAFISDGKTLVDLNSRLVGEHREIALDEAIAINVRGQILVRGPNGHPYLLTPTAEALAAPPPCVDPASTPHGSGATLVHHGNDATLTFIGVCGEPHSYVVARPRFAAAMMPGADSGGWIHAAADRQSGILFNVAPSGDVTSSPLSGPQLRMMVGP